MTRIERIGDATLYLGDCREILPTLGKVDAILTDPPYGIGENGRRVRSRGTSSERVKRTTVIDYGDFEWDSKPPSDDTVALMRAISDTQIIFGGNYFTLPPTPCWLVWDKLNTGDFADCELAWTTLQQAVRRIQYHWNGCMRKERHIPREHPTQKPLGVMEWCLGFIPAMQTVVDPFMGSGTTGVACANLDRKFIGIEIEERYFDIAYKRIADAYSSPRLFTEPPPKHEQVQMFEDTP